MALYPARREERRMERPIMPPTIITVSYVMVRVRDGDKMVVVLLL